MPKKQAIKNQPKYTIYKYTVVEFEDEIQLEKLFECIPDRWFLDDSKSRCYWPPQTGTSFSLRAIRCEKPDDSWDVCEVKVISEGHLTYNSGFKIVVEKCRQKYNTSSAEEQIEAANYRRKHPVLAMQNKSSGSLEHIFAKPNETSKDGTKKKHNAKPSSKKSSTASNIPFSISNDNSSNPNFDENSPVESLIQNSDFGNIEPDESEMNLVSDCGNKNTNDTLVDNQNLATIAPKITSNDNYISATETAPVSPPNLSRHHSTHTLSGSNSNVSGSGGSRSNKSRSSCSTSSRSNSSRSRSNCRSPSKRKRRNCSSSTEFGSGSSRSINDNRRPPIHKEKLVKKDGNSNSRFDNASTYKFNDRKKSTGKAPGAWHSSSFYSSRSRSHQSISSSSSLGGSHSKSNRNRSRSRSRTALNATVRQKSNYMETHRQFQDIRQNSGREINRRSINDRHKNRRPDRSGNVNSKSKRSINCTLRSRSGHRRSNYSRSSRRLSFSPGSTQREKSSNQQKNNAASSKFDSSADLIKVVKELTDTISKNNQQLKEHDRRFHRMELTLNKTFLLVCDLSGNTGPVLDELANDQGFEIPILPINSSNELAVMKRKLKDKDFRNFFLQHEKDFCCPTKKSTDTVTISKYLMRFISLRVRCKITLKENGEDGATLFKDYNSVYLFLIDVMKAGYKTCKKAITNDDAHSALRIVWGRSKQYYREQQERSQR